MLIYYRLETLRDSILEKPPEERAMSKFHETGAE